MSKDVESGRNHHILLLFSRLDMEIYEIAMFDTGIPFPEYVLDYFGKRGITTSEVGTGNGLADIVKVLEDARASLVIETKMSPQNIYTKGIRLVFDGKNHIQTRA